jgi:predicted DCC family thiol-disulfide oxidoreductase YuxK
MGRGVGVFHALILCITFKPKFPASMKKLVLFDGHCNLCNKSVQFILNHERKPELFFASLQSDIGQAILKEHHFPANYTDSVLFFQNEQLFQQSTAALKISRYLRFPWRMVRMGYIIPRFLRDVIYRYVAKNRLRWFGETDSCWVMTKEWKERFLG